MALQSYDVARKFYSALESLAYNTLDSLNVQVVRYSKTPALLAKNRLEMLKTIDQWDDQTLEQECNAYLTRYPDLQDWYITIMQLYIREYCQPLEPPAIYQFLTFKQFIRRVYGELLHHHDRQANSPFLNQAYSQFLASGAYFEPRNFAQRLSFHRSAIDAAVAAAVRTKAKPRAPGVDSMPLVMPLPLLGGGVGRSTLQFSEAAPGLSQFSPAAAAAQLGAPATAAEAAAQAAAAGIPDGPTGLAALQQTARARAESSDLDF